MNWDLILLLVFFLLIYLFYSKNKSKFEVQGKIFFLYRTKWGLKLMNKISSRFPRFQKFISHIGIYVGFAGMIMISYLIIQGTTKLIMAPKSQPALAPVLPGIEIAPGLPVLSFMHWVIVIFIVALIHEFSHGIVARLHKVKLKSSGFAFLGPIPAAFVEPDEKQVAKKSRKAQLSILAAGPFSNIITAFVFFLIILFVFVPIQSSMAQPSGLYIVSTEQNYPANLSGLPSESTIVGINGNSLLSSQDFLNFISTNNKTFIINTDKGNFTVTPTLENGRYVIGIHTIQLTEYNKNISKILVSTFIWLFELFNWLWIISLGIGLFNLLPLGPVDGGRMLLVGLTYITKSERKAKNIWKYVSFFIVSLIVINLLPYLIKLIMWIFSLI
jgi:membrane-associated protease RseP (regulator of RpoE activity)